MDRPRPPVSSPRTQPRPRRWPAYAAFGVVAVIAIPLAVGGVFLAQFDPNAYAPDIQAAVQQATGRALSLGQPITLQLSLTPTLSAGDITLANPPNFADPALLTLDKVQARIALLPLLSHRIDILSLTLQGPKLYLERDTAGQADWNFASTGASNAPAGGPPTPASPSAPAAGYKIALEAVQLQNGQIIVRPHAGAKPGIIQLTSLTGQAASLDAPLHLQGAATLGQSPLTLTGSVGPVSRLTGDGDDPWPVDLTLGYAGASAILQGQVARPQNARGYDLKFSAAIPALEDVGAALPPGWTGGLTLPPIHNLTLLAQIRDQGSTFPDLTNLSIKTGASDLSAWRAGLQLAGLDVELPALNQPGQVSASGTLGPQKFNLQGNFTAPSAFIPPAWLPAGNPPAGSFAESLNASLGQAGFSLSGGIATPRTLAGAALALNLNIPDLTSLAGAAGQALPGWRNISVKTNIIDPGGQGLTHAIGLDSFAANMDNAAFGGDASLTFGFSPRLELDLNIANADLDKLLAALPASPANSNAPALASAPAPAPAAPRAIPNIALPLKLLRNASADLLLNAQSLTYNKATYTALQGHAVLQNGVLTLNPLTGQLPGGAVSLTGTLDASREPAAASVNFTAPALALAPVLRAFGLPDAAQGTVQVRLAASGTGDSLPALAATLNGQLGMASVNGVVDGTVLDGIFGAALRAVALPASLAASPGPVPVRCAAIRVDAVNGIGTVKALTLDSSRLLMQGGGTVNFAAQSLGLVLRPQLRVAGTNVTIPVQISGSFLDPHYGVAPTSAVEAAAGAATGLALSPVQKVLGTNTLLGQVAGFLGAGGTQADVCPAALSLARFGQAGPAAPPPANSNQPANANTNAAPATGPRSLLNLLGQ